MHVMELPKVLIINQPFNNETGGGITLSNLFSGWDKDKLSVVCSPYLINENTNTEVCHRYYKLGQKEHIWIFPFNLFNKKNNSGPWKTDNNKAKQKIEEESNWKSRVSKDHILPILNSIGVLNGLFKYKLSPELCQWLDDFKPDVIYAQAQKRANVLFCTAVQEYLNKPMVFHMMDDWPELIKQKGLLRIYWS